MKKTVLSLALATIAIAVQAQSNSNSELELDNSKKLIDNGYFQYEVTGDTQVDEENYGKAKSEFVEKYPEKYAEMVEKFAQDANLNTIKNDGGDNVPVNPD